MEEGGGELGRISLNKGAGSCCLVWEGKTEERGIERVKSGSLQIELPGGRMLKTVWKEPVWVLVQKEEAAEEKENAGEEEKDKGASEIVPAIEYPELKWRDAEAIFEPEMRINSSVEEDTAQETGKREDAGEAGEETAIEYPELKWRDAEAIFEPEMRINSSVEEDTAQETGKREDAGEAGEETATQAEVRKAPPSPDVPAPVSDCTWMRRRFLNRKCG